LSDADDYLTKPCDSEEINFRVFQCLESDDFLNPDNNHKKQIKKFQGSIIIIKALEFAKLMIEFQKTAFNNAYNAMVMLQEQTERMTETLLNQTPIFPEVGEKALDTLLKTYKKGRQHFKKSVDENYQIAEDFFYIVE
jgi:hypothetical protein